jgi:tyrosyl-tRNA synthetase
VPAYQIIKDRINEGINIIDFLVETGILPSKGEARKLIQNGGISINKWQVDRIEYNVSYSDVILNQYITIQKGKKNYYLIKTV